MKSIDEARNVLEEAALMTTETVRAFYGSLKALMLTPPALAVHPWPDIDAGDKASQAYMMAVHQHARPVPQRHGAPPRRSGRGWGTPQ
jgi:hypothetical protein